VNTGSSTTAQEEQQQQTPSSAAAVAAAAAAAGSVDQQQQQQQRGGRGQDPFGPQASLYYFRDKGLWTKLRPGVSRDQVLLMEGVLKPRDRAPYGRTEDRQLQHPWVIWLVSSRKAPGNMASMADAVLSSRSSTRQGALFGAC
jgi:hypothetical protein